jgi:hypothetical protein
MTGNLLTAEVLPGISTAFTWRRATVWPSQSERVMKKDRKETSSSEPLGIIISRGDKTEPTPVFSAYIWGPVPETEQEAANRAA